MVSIRSTVYRIFGVGKNKITDKVITDIEVFVGVFYEKSHLIDEFCTQKTPVTKMTLVFARYVDFLRFTKDTFRICRISEASAKKIHENSDI